MGATIAVNTRTVVHKGSGGQAIASAPDVCKTPSPGGPVPIPYPNLALSSDTAKGSKKVKMDGNPIMLKGSEFSISSGNEAGTAGGGIVSSKIKGKAKFVTYSFDVKVENKNAARLADLMTTNGNASNDVATETQVNILVSDLTEVAKDCNESVNEKWDKAQEKKDPKGPKHTDCKAHTEDKMGDGTPMPVQVKLGNLKEQCVNDALGEDPGTLKSQCAFDSDGKYKGKGKPFGTAKTDKGGGIPDFCITREPLVSANDVLVILELKFSCKKGKKKGTLTWKQKANWPKIFKKAFPPHIIP